MTEDADLSHGLWSTFGPSVMFQRPHLAPYIATVSSVWALIESSLTDLLSLFLEANTHLGYALLESASSDHSKLKMIKAAAKVSLRLEEYQEFDALLKRHESIGRTFRHPIVHGIWMVSDTYPDALLWHNPKETARRHAAIAMHPSNPDRIEKLTANLSPPKVWREDSFRRACDEVSALLAAIQNFHFRLMSAQIERQQKKA